MKYKNKETGHIVERFENADCDGIKCRNCPVNKKYNEEGFATCTLYADQHQEEALALLGYYPMEEPEEKPRFRFEDYPGRYSMHVKSKTEAEQFCLAMDNAGRRWQDGNSYAEESEWDSSLGGLCYDFNFGEYGYYDRQKKAGEMTILEFSDFDWSRAAPTIKDSGDRTQYSTGAVRDCKEGKGRCDLMPLDVVGCFDPDRVIINIGKFKAERSVGYLNCALREFAKIRYNGDAYAMWLEVSKHFEDGAKKYGENNWQKGIPVHSYIDSAVRHYLKYRAGWKDEPHDRAFVWNILCCIWTMENHPELDDWTEKGEKTK